MSPHLDDLLRPSLSGHDNSGTIIYSATAGFLTSFFGGPVAGAVIALLNARRLNRLSKDWPVLFVAIALTAAVVWWDLRASESWITGLLGKNAGDVIMRMAGLAFFSGIYWLHRQSYRSMEVLGLKPAPGWLPAIAAFITGIVSMYVFTMVLMP